MIGFVEPVDDQYLGADVCRGGRQMLLRCENSAIARREREHMADKCVERLLRIANEWRDDLKQWGDQDGAIAADIEALESAAAALQQPARRDDRARELCYNHLQLGTGAIACLLEEGHYGHHHAQGDNWHASWSNDGQSVTIGRRAVADEASSEQSGRARRER